MARVCRDSCERDGDFIKENLTNEEFGYDICCCCCPILEKCKALDDGIGCPKAKDGTYNADTCINCKYCTEETIDN